MSERTTLPVASGLSKVPAPPPRRTTTSRPSSPPEAPPRLLAAVTDPTTVTAADASPPTAETAHKAAPATRKQPVSKSSTGGTKETSVSLPVGVKEKWRAAADARSTTLVEVLLTAIEEAGERLADMVAAERPSPAKAAGLFPDRFQRPAAREARSTAPLETSHRNFEVLDRLVKQTGADSRSQLITAALRAHLADIGGQDEEG